MLTITGTIIVIVVAWITGTLFMPKRASVLHKGKSKFYKGVITAEGPLFDHRLLLIPFNADTLLNHTILELDRHHFKLKSIKDNSVIVFTK